MQIHLIRHGETDYNQVKRIQGHSPSVLSENGREQAGQISDSLHLSEKAIVLCSEMGRAVETAEIIAKNHNLEIIKRFELNARDFGKLSGLTLQEISIKFPEDYEKMKSDRGDFTPPDGEPTHQIIKRLTNFIASLEEYEELYTDLVIVTHREIIPLMLKLTNPNLENIPDHPYKVQNCAIYSFDLEQSGNF